MKPLFAFSLLFFIFRQPVSALDESACASDVVDEDLAVCTYSSLLRMRKKSEDKDEVHSEPRNLGVFSSIRDFLTSHSSIQSNKYTVTSPASPKTCTPPVPSNNCHCGISFAFLLSYNGDQAECVSGVASADSKSLTVEMGNSDELTLDFGCKDYYTNGYSDFGISIVSGSKWRVLGYRTEVYTSGSINQICNACKYGDTYYNNYCSEVTGAEQSPTQPPLPSPPPTSDFSPVNSPSPTPKLDSSPTNPPDNNPEAFAALVRSDVADLLISDPILAPKLVRMGFHDCVGGCDGCIDLSNPDNNGLDIPINALDSIVQKYTVSQNTGLSRSDIWALAALTAADMSQSSSARVNFPFSWIGRKDCENVQSVCSDKNNQQQACDATRGPHRQMPSGEFTTAELLHFFSSEFGFNASQTVALMGAHTLGSAHRQTTGYDGPLGWVPNNLVLSNSYYQNLVGGSGGTSDSIETMTMAPDWSNNFIDNSNIANVPSRWQWEQNGFIMLDVDIALVRDFSDAFDEGTGRVTCSFLPPTSSLGGSGCPFASITGEFVAKYKKDELLWLSDFRDVFIKVLLHGYDTSESCGKSLCVLG